MIDEQEKRAALREEAASWFAAMQGPDARRREAEFRTWLAADTSHRSAYARIAEIYSMGRSLISSPSGNRAKTPRRRIHQVALAAAIAMIVGSVALVTWVPAKHEKDSSSPQLTRNEVAANSFRSRVGEIRTIRLADGSNIILDTDSVVSTRLSSATRSLRLERGKARFEVAHENRPFMVSVGDAMVTAHGTVFDVGFRSDRTYFVRLLRGSVDVVQRERNPGSVKASKPRLLSPGQVIEAGAFGLRDLPASFAPASGASWTSKMRQFDNVRLADLINEANRYSRLQIRQPAPDIADLRASGTFAIDDPHRLATNLSLLFALEVTEVPGNGIALTSFETKISHSEAPAP